jgi:hypothetical protein
MLGQVCRICSGVCSLSPHSQRPISGMETHQCSKSSYFTRHWQSGIYIIKITIFEGTIRQMLFLKAHFLKPLLSAKECRRNPNRAKRASLVTKSLSTESQSCVHSKKPCHRRPMK